MPQPFPKLVAFDLDGTIWSGWLNEYKLGQHGWVTSDKHKEDNLELQTDSTIRDKKNPHGFKVRVAKDFPKIAHDVLKHGGRIAIASRNTNKSLTDRSKLEHFELFQGWLQEGYDQMILFDDKNENKEVELWKGVTFQKVENPGEGITWTDYCRGIDTWRRYQAIRIPLPQYSPSSRRYFVGYVGTDVPNAERYKNGCRRLPTDRSARWGYGLYASDNPYIALFFSSAKRDDVEKKNLRIVKLYARDKNAFMNMQKCWVPERGKFHRIDSEHLSFEETCNKNDRLDLKVWKELGFHKPYLLFTRHHQMEDMDFLKKLERFNELVIYPQAQDAMFYGEVYTIEEAEAKVKSGEWKHREWNHHMKAWGIKMHPETKEEFFLTEKEKKEGEVKEWKLLEDPRDFY